MKINCGTDIIEIDRIQKAIEKNPKFVQTVFTESEIEYCESHKMQKYQHYAARFATKEAVYKALSKKIDKNKLSWRDFEIINENDGKPKLNLLFKIEELEDIDISISHCKQYATATAIAIFKS